MLSKLCNVLMTTIICIFVFIAGALLLPRLFNYQVFGVLSGSMEPAFPVGSVVYVKSTQPDSVQIGDAITFRIENLDSVVATHRVVDINYEMRTFTTKGDANEVVDNEPVAFEHLIGRADFKIPYLGYITMFIQTKAGIVASIGIFLFVVFISLLEDVLKKEKNTVIEEQKTIENGSISNID